MIEVGRVLGRRIEHRTCDYWGRKGVGGEEKNKKAKSSFWMVVPIRWHRL